MITPSFSLTATERVLPKLALDFTTASLDPRVTFTRATSASNPATYTNSSGVITAATNNQPRFDYDSIALTCKGLLIEEARTNLFTQSSDFSVNWSRTNISVNTTAIIAPDGSLTGNLATTSTGTGQITRNMTATSTSHSFSIFVKKGTTPATSSTFIIRNTTTATNLAQVTVTWATMSFVSNIGGAANTWADFGNGWWRVTLSAFSGITVGNLITNYAWGTTAQGFDIYLWGAQFEAGAFATSYIPTTTTALTRNADVATMTGTNFSDWYNASEGTFNVGFMFNTEPGYTSGGTSQRALYVSDGTTNNRMDVVRTETSSDRMFMVVQAAGSLDVYAAINTLNTTSNTQYNVCFAYKQNSVAAAISGLTPLTDSVVNIPTVNQLRFGALTATTGLINGYIISTEYYPQRLTTNEVQAFSKG